MYITEYSTFEEKYVNTEYNKQLSITIEARWIDKVYTGVWLITGIKYVPIYYIFIYQLCGILVD